MLLVICFFNCIKDITENTIQRACRFSIRRWVAYFCRVSLNYLPKVGGGGAKQMANMAKALLLLLQVYTTISGSDDVFDSCTNLSVRNKRCLALNTPGCPDEFM